MSLFVVGTAIYVTLILNAKNETGDIKPPFGTSPEWTPIVFDAGVDEIEMLGDTHVFCLEGHYTKVFFDNDGTLESIHYFPEGSC